METGEPELIRRLRAFLDTAGADYTIIAHESVLASAEDGVAEGLGALWEMAPTLVLKTKIAYLAAVIGGERRMVYKKVKKVLGLKDVSLAAPEQVRGVTGAEPGSISLVNPGLETILDASLLEREHIYGGTGLPGYTLQIRTADLVRVTGARVFDFTDPKAVG